MARLEKPVVESACQLRVAATGGRQSGDDAGPEIVLPLLFSRTVVANKSVN